MAILKPGGIGPFKGQVGGIVGYQLYDQNIIRTLPVRVKREPTELEAINRHRMKVVSEFLTPVKDIVKFGYKNLIEGGGRVGAFQKAQSYTFKNSLDYDLSNGNMPYVNPEKVLLFQGDLSVANMLAFEVSDEGLLFSWETILQRYSGDQLIAVLYNVEQKAVDFLTGGADISVGEFLWKANVKGFKHEGITHVYAGFHNPVDGSVSNSVYCGCF